MPGWPWEIIVIDVRSGADNAIYSAIQPPYDTITIQIVQYWKIPHSLIKQTLGDRQKPSSKSKCLPPSFPTNTHIDVYEFSLQFIKLSCPSCFVVIWYISSRICFFVELKLDNNGRCPMTIGICKWILNFRMIYNQMTSPVFVNGVPPTSRNVVLHNMYDRTSNE